MNKEEKKKWLQDTAKLASATLGILTCRFDDLFRKTLTPALKAIEESARDMDDSLVSGSYYYDVRDAGFSLDRSVHVNRTEKTLTLKGFWAKSRHPVLGALHDIMTDRRFVARLEQPWSPEYALLQVAERLMDEPGIGATTALQFLGAVKPGGATREESLEIAFLSCIVNQGWDYAEGTRGTSGNTCWPAGHLETTTMEFLGKPREDAEKFLENLREGSRRLVRLGDGSWTTPLALDAAKRIVDMAGALDGRALGLRDFNPDCRRTDEQVESFRTALEGGRRGGAVNAAGGTGKTDTTAVLVEEFLEENPRAVVGVLTPTGVAAKTLQKRFSKAGVALAGGGAMTIDRAACDRKYPPRLDLLVVDEASMMSDSHLSGLPQADRYLFTGDLMQLPPVEPGQPFRDLVSVLPSSTLTRNLRAVPDDFPLQACLDEQRRGNLVARAEYSLACRNLKYIASSDKKRGQPWTSRNLVEELRERAGMAMYNALEDAYANGWAVTSVRKDIMVAVQKYFLEHDSEQSTVELRQWFALEIHALGILTVRKAAELFPNLVRDAPDFQEGAEIVWCSAREKTRNDSGLEILTYTGEPGTVHAVLDDRYVLHMENGARIDVPFEDCRNASGVPFCLRWVRNTHKFQSEAAPEVLYITPCTSEPVDGPHSGGWVTFDDRSAAYTACSRAQLRYHVFPTRGPKGFEPLVLPDGRGGTVQSRDWLLLPLRDKDRRNTPLSMHPEFAKNFPEDLLTG